MQLNSWSKRNCWRDIQGRNWEMKARVRERDTDILIYIIYIYI